MGPFEPFISILTVLTVLSVAAERATDVIKLRHDAKWREEADAAVRKAEKIPEADKTDRSPDPDRQKKVDAIRHSWIANTSIVMGVGVALLMKADLFAIIARPDAPWSTLGWVRWDGTAWVRQLSVTGYTGIAQILLGCALTGLALGFGSRFWHDILEIVLDTSQMVKNRTPQPMPNTTGE